MGAAKFADCWVDIHQEWETDKLLKVAPHSAPKKAAVKM